MKDLGYDVIAFDMRGAGSSLGSPSYTGSREVSWCLMMDVTCV